MREICWHGRVKQPICEDAHADGDSYEKRKPYRGAILNGLRIAAFCPLRSVQLLRCHCEFPPSPEGNARDCSVVPLRHFVEITPALLALPDSLHTLGRAEAQRALISVPASRASARISIMGGSASAASSQTKPGRLESHMVVDPDAGRLGVAHHEVRELRSHFGCQ